MSSTTCKHMHTVRHVIHHMQTDTYCHTAIATSLIHHVQTYAYCSPRHPPCAYCSRHLTHPTRANIYAFYSPRRPPSADRYILLLAASPTRRRAHCPTVRPGGVRQHVLRRVRGGGAGQGCSPRHPPHARHVNDARHVIHPMLATSTMLATSSTTCYPSFLFSHHMKWRALLLSVLGLCLSYDAASILCTRPYLRGTRRRRGTTWRGRAVQVEPFKPMLKAPGTKRLKL